MGEVLTIKGTENRRSIGIIGEKARQPPKKGVGSGVNIRCKDEEACLWRTARGNKLFHLEKNAYSFSLTSRGGGGERRSLNEEGGRGAYKNEIA